MIQDQNGLSGCIRSVHGFLCLQCGELHAKTIEFLTIQNPTQEGTQCYAIQRKVPSGWHLERTPKLAILQVQCNNAVVHTAVGTSSFYIAMLSTPSLRG